MTPDSGTGKVRGSSQKKPQSGELAEQTAEQEGSGNFSVSSNTVAFIRSKALMRPIRGIQLVKNHSGGSSFLMYSFMTSAKNEIFAEVC